MGVVRIAPNIYSVGVVDWNMPSFHGHTYTTARGTTYNSYLIVDDKVALIDAVARPFTDEFINNITQIVPLSRIDYVVANHVETDHTGALPELMKLCPNAVVVGTQKCKDGLQKHYYGNWNFQVVKTNDTLSLGSRTLSFIEAPMIHWPDSMFTYCPQEELLLPNDAFGQHLASSQRFDDEIDQCVLMDEAAKYYANILWPLSAVILRKIQELQKLKLPIRVIAPSHGIIWRTQPNKIINSYLSWAGNEVKEKVVIAYETMWGSTTMMARLIAQGIESSGVDVSIFDVATRDRTAIFAEMLETKGYLFGSSTHDSGMLPSMVSFMEFVKGLKPKNRLCASFGSFGWSGGAVKEIEDVISAAGLPISMPALSVKYVPDESEKKACFEFGKKFGLLVKGGA